MIPPACAWCAEPATQGIVRYGTPYCSEGHSVKGRWDERGLTPVERLGRLAARVEREDPEGQGWATAHMLRARLALLVSAPQKAADGAAGVAAHWVRENPEHPLCAIYCEAAEYCRTACARQPATSPAVEVVS